MNAEGVVGNGVGGGDLSLPVLAFCSILHRHKQRYQYTLAACSLSFCNFAMFRSHCMCAFMFLNHVEKG